MTHNDKNISFATALSGAQELIPCKVVSTSKHVPILMRCQAQIISTYVLANAAHSSCDCTGATGSAVVCQVFLVDHELRCIVLRAW